VRFLGAARTVTGSRFLVETRGARVLVDAGLFQGGKQLRLRNWDPLPVDPASIDAVVATHAHVDHIGYLPALTARGFGGPVYATEFTRRLAGVVLPDSGRLQEEDARYANKVGSSKHRPALPLFTEEDATAALTHFRDLEWHRPAPVADGVEVELSRAGHILGSASATLRFDDGTPPLHLSGDLGRPYHPILHPPDAPPACGTLVVESTYAERDHPDDSPEDRLAAAVANAVERRGAIVIPAFSVDRTEVVLLTLRRLVDAGRIPDLAVYLDSPMGADALALYRRAILDREPEIRPEMFTPADPLDPGGLRVARSVEDSKAINDAELPAIIISASGMATGGRVLHHLSRRLPDPDSTVVLVGFQAPGTRGASLLAGEAAVKIHGRYVPVRARVVSIPEFSVHADGDEILDWIASAPELPRLALAVHGDDEASVAMARAIRERFGTVAVAPHLDEQVLLS
jgi:metallo-beta-lactamase family protein